MRSGLCSTKSLTTAGRVRPANLADLPAGRSAAGPIHSGLPRNWAAMCRQAGLTIPDVANGEQSMASEINIYNPQELGPPMGQYTHVTRVKANEFLFIAGMLSGDSKGNIIGAGDFDVQAAQVFKNVEAALKSAGAGWGNVVQFTTYLVHSQDIPKFMAFRLREFPKMFPNGKYPPNTLLMVDRLVQEPFLVEVQTIAAI
jgi:enamine deaminase RidA (YjgF/YER057c/UK114 family)